MLRVGFKSLDTLWNTKSEGIWPIMIDADKRRFDQETGLDTPDTLSVNDEW